MATWYQLSGYGQKTIKQVEVVRETVQFVVVLEKDWPDHKPTERRRSKGGEYFPTFAEARAYAVASAERNLQDAEDRRSRAISELKAAREIAEFKRLSGPE